MSHQQTLPVADAAPQAPPSVAPTPATATPAAQPGSAPPLWAGLPTAVIAALTGWLALQSWRGMADEPNRFLAPLAVAAALIAVLGWAVRRLKPSAWPALLVQVVVLTVWLVHRSGAGWLPTPRALSRFAGVLADGAAAGQRYTSPVSTEHLQFHFLLLVGGVAILLAIDLLCGLHRATLAGLPLLLTITISTSVLLAPFGTRLFLLTALGWLALIAIQETERVSSWGRGVVSGFGTVAWLSVRIALGCALVAVVLSGALSSQGRQFGSIGQSPGNGRIDVDNPILDLRRNLVQGKDIPLVVVNTRGQAPSYLRTTVLDRFTGETWEPSRRTVQNTSAIPRQLPSPPGLDQQNSGPTVLWRIHVVSEFKSQWLPVPFPASTIGVGQDWRYDSDTFDVFGVDNTNAAGLTYDATALSPLIDPTALRAAQSAPVALQSPMTTLPNNLPAVFRTTAAQVTRTATNNFDRAVLLQRWFRTDGGFTYSTKPSSGSGISTLARFISNDRVGYCEQFSTAMAVMARALNIPARVAVGFLRPQKTAQGYVFSSHDLHAWPELYFEGVGWIRFEPTPQDRASSPPSYTTVALPDDPTSLPTGPSGSAKPLANSKKPQLPDQTGTAAAQRESDPGPWPWLGAGVLVLLAGALLPRVVRSRTSRRRWSRVHTAQALADAAWSEVRATALDLDLGWSEWGTVRSNGQLVQREIPPVPQARDAIEEVVRFVELTRYARPRPLASGLHERLHREVHTWRESMFGAVDARRSRRARWWPRSVTGSVTRSALSDLRDRLRTARRS